MDIPQDQILEEIQKRLLQDHSVSEDMEAILSICQEHCPSPDWDQFSLLPYDDLNGLDSWLTGLLVNKSPGRSIKGIWFGLFNPVYEQEDTTCDLYISGASEFEWDDIDWACDQDYFPDSAYAHSEMLGQIYHSAYGAEDSLGNEAEYPLCLAYSCFALKRLISTPSMQNLLTQKAKKLGIAIGYDDGDYVILGELTREGFAPSKPKAIST